MVIIQNPPVQLLMGRIAFFALATLDMLGYPLVMNENKNRNRYGSASDADEDL